MAAERALPEAAMDAVLLSARQFDTRLSFGAGRRATPDRITQCYEFSLYHWAEGGLFCDGAVHPLTGGCCRLTPPGVTVHSLPHYGCSTVYFGLSPAENGAFPRCRNDFLDRLPDFWQSCFPERYGPVLEQLIARSFDRSVGAAVAVKAELFRLLTLIAADAVRADGPRQRAVEIALRYMETHCGETVTLDDLGRLTGYHPLYFQRIFREQTGISPLEQLTDLRMALARRLLVTTDDPVYTVAAACGYGSVSHFSTVFRAKNGLSPTSFRRRHEILP